MDVIIQQSIVYGAVATIFLSHSLPKKLPERPARWFKHIRRPVLTAILLYLFYLPFAQERRNYYALLDVNIHASKNDIVQGFRTVSKRYHPDKVASSGVVPPFSEGMTPDEYFMTLKHAQDILTHDSRKSVYDRFGDMPSVIDLDEKIALTAVFLSLAAHLTFFCIGFVMCYVKHVIFARQVFVVYNIATFCIDLQERFIDEDALNFLPFVRNLLPFEKIQFFRELFPFVLVGSLTIASWLYVDVPGQQYALLKALLSVNRVLTERMQEVVRATVYLKSFGTPSIAELKAIPAAQQGIQSAAARAKASGMDVGASLETGTVVSSTTGTSAKTPTTGTAADQNAAPAKPSNEPKSEWDTFTGGLSEEQKELFKRMVAEQYRKTEAEAQVLEKERKRYDINWSQMLLWVSILFFWVYYK